MVVQFLQRTNITYFQDITKKELAGTGRKQI